MPDENLHDSTAIPEATKYLILKRAISPRIDAEHYRAFTERIPVPALGPRVVCTSCGIIGASAPPNCQACEDVPNSCEVSPSAG
jgi:hypothetical protein